MPQKEVLIAHLYESGVLANLTKLLDADKIEKLCIASSLAHLGVYSFSSSNSSGSGSTAVAGGMAGYGITYVNAIFADLHEPSSFLLRADVFSTLSLAVAGISSLISSESSSSSSTSQQLVMSLLRRTPLLSHTLRTLTTGVMNIVQQEQQQAVSHESSNSTSDSARDDRLVSALMCIGSAAICLKALLESSALTDSFNSIVSSTVPAALGVNSLDAATYSFCITKINMLL
jgi:hypothetical protein